MPSDDREIAASLRKVLNSHGHGFHYAVIRRAEELKLSGRGRWNLEAAEIPVVTRGSSTHIDFVMTNDSGFTFLVAECKRADPAKARWCFARAPYTWRNIGSSELVFDQFISTAPDEAIHTPCIVHKPA